jgi:hypothetical protein
MMTCEPSSWTSSCLRSSARLGDARQHDALEQDEHRRRQHHRDRDRGDERRGERLVVDVRLDAERQQHERELADLRERERERPARRAIELEQPREAIEHGQLRRHRDQHDRDDHHRLAADQPEVDLRTDRDEEQPEQQALERLDVGLELVAILAIGEHDAGEERAERGRQPDHLHEQRDADDDQQRRGRERLAQLRAGEELEHRAHDEAADPDDADHRSDHQQARGPRGQARLGGEGDQERGAVGKGELEDLRRSLGRRRAEQREDREDRDHGDVLEQQHREARLPTRGLEEALLGERRQHDRGRRHRERHADGERHLPLDADHQREREDRGRGDRHL